MKFAIVLRDPIERAWSHWRMAIEITDMRGGVMPGWVAKLVNNNNNSSFEQQIVKAMDEYDKCALASGSADSIHIYEICNHARSVRGYYLLYYLLTRTHVSPGMHSI